jgi:hypothetical protein
MSCRKCQELEQFLQSAEVPYTPKRLDGLSEKSLRNHLQQREENIEKQKMLLLKHKKTCSDGHRRD